MIEGQATEMEKLKESEGENGVPENAKNAWSVIAALPADKCDIIKMVTTERNKAQMKEKNLVVFGVKETTDKAEIKEEILRILDVIQMKRHGSNARMTRYKESGPITVEFESIETKMKVLRAAKGLRESEDHKRVYINMDLTKAEMERGKELRKEQNEANDKLNLGTGNRKYGMHKFDDSENEVEFYWGIRRDQLVRIKRR